jgi:predicted dehydrogenase
MCVSRDELKALVELVNQEQAYERIHVGFNRRYSPLSGILKTEVDNRPGAPLTIIYRINAGVLTPGHWFYDDPGGRITAEGCHFIDYCLFLIGQPVAELHCVAKSARDRPFDSFTVSLRFTDGSMGTVVYAGDGDRSLPKEHIEVFRGGSCWINSDWSSLVRHEGGKQTVLYKGRQSKGWHEGFAHFAGHEQCLHARLDWPAIVRSHEAMFDAIDSAVHASSAADEA